MEKNIKNLIKNFYFYVRVVTFPFVLYIYASCNCYILVTERKELILVIENIREE